MSTPDQKLSSKITGEALRAAQRAELQPIIDQLAEVCQGRDDLRIEAAGNMAGAWFANPEAAPRWGYELIAAGMLLVGGSTTATGSSKRFWTVGSVDSAACAGTGPVGSLSNHGPLSDEESAHGVKWQVALTFPLTVATIRPVPPKQGTEPTKVLLNEYPSGRSPLATIVVTPESVVTIVHLAGKDTSTPGTSPGSKKQSSGRSTNAAAEAGAAATTDVATTAASPKADSAIERILMATPKK